MTAPAFDIGAELERISETQNIARKLGRQEMAQDVAAALDGPGTALETLHAVARMCEKESAKA